jgi:serine/threonine protein kinase
MMIEDNDILFLSIVDDFIAPNYSFSNSISDQPKNSRSEAEKIPPSIGGFKVGDLLGKGGFGEVRHGEHQLTGEKVALKFLRKSEIHSLGAAERTNTEIQCLTALKHINIIRLLQVNYSKTHYSSC